MIVPPDINLAALGPALALLLSAAVGLIVGTVTRDGRNGGAVAFLGLLVAGLLGAFNLAAAREEAFTTFGLQWSVDAASAGLVLAAIVGAFLAMLSGWDAVRRTGMDRPEYYPLVLLATTGAVVMLHAGDFVALLLGLEILSLSVYALSAWRTDEHGSEEAGMKYFLLGAFASAILVYGMALTYGATGAFAFTEIGAALQGGAAGPLALLGGVFVLVGLAFKVSFAPFHQWAPDVYTGAPTPVTAFMSVVVKVAAFGALLRVASEAWAFTLPTLDLMLATLIGTTVIIGNLGALLQSGAKRMLAYSAVAHAGYLGLAVLAVGDGLAEPAIVAWYLLAYTLMNGGAFAVLSEIMGDDPHGDHIEAWEGLGRRRPGLAVAMTIFLLSLAGIPPLAGFFGKALAVQAAFAAGWAELAVIALLAAVVAVVYYTRFVWAMWFVRNRKGEVQHSPAARWAIGLAAAGTVAMGLFPDLWYGLVQGLETLTVAAGR